MTAILLTLSLFTADTPLVCLTPIEVRTANLILDECERDRELLTVSELQLAEANKAIASLNALLDKSKADVSNLETLDSSRVVQLTDCHASHDAVVKSGKNGWTWAKVFGIFAAIEGVLIGIGAATK